MNKQVQLLFMIAFALFAMQSLGGWFQIRDYRKAIRRIHRLGNVGIGQKKGGFLSGYLVLIACDAGGLITGAEILKELEALDKKKRRHYKGYIQALEALKMRLEEEAAA